MKLWNKRNVLKVDGVEIMPRDYRALKQYYEIVQEENEKLKADLRGKDNEIEVLEWRVKYLSQFKPIEDNKVIVKGDGGDSL